MKAKICLIIGFILHVLSGVCLALAVAALFFQGDVSDMAYPPSFAFWIYTIYLALFAMNFYVIDMFLALFRDFSFFSIIKAIAIVGGSALLVIFGGSPDMFSQVIWHVFSTMLFFLQIKSFSRDYD